LSVASLCRIAEQCVLSLDCRDHAMAAGGSVVSRAAAMAQPKKSGAIVRPADAKIPCGLCLRTICLQQSDVGLLRPAEGLRPAGRGNSGMSTPSGDFELRWREDYLGRRVYTLGSVQLPIVLIMSALVLLLLSIHSGMGLLTALQADDQVNPFWYFAAGLSLTGFVVLFVLGDRSLRRQRLIFDPKKRRIAFVRPHGRGHERHFDYAQVQLRAQTRTVSQPLSGKWDVYALTVSHPDFQIILAQNQRREPILRLANELTEAAGIQLSFSEQFTDA